MRKKVDGMFEATLRGGSRGLVVAILLGMVVIPSVVATNAPHRADSRISGGGRVVAISNPYAGVNFDTDGPYLGNFHTHTTQSDGRQSPADVIDEYHAQGYHALAISDHSNQTPTSHPTTFPWQDFGRDPLELGMVDVEGNELSIGDHLVSLFTDYTSRNRDVDTRLAGIGANGGIGYFAHPGRYSRSAQWYADHYYNHPYIFGQAIYNQGDRYSADRAMWDEVLRITMPDRPVWGISEDDSHNASHIGRNRTYMFMPELTHASVRESLMSGAFYATYSGQNQTPPALTGVMVDEIAGTITLFATNYTTVRWISMGQEVATGETIDLVNTGGVERYVRAEFQGPEGRMYTNPFGMVEWFVNRPPAVSAGPNQTVQVGAVAILNGSASDDGLPDPPGELSILWEQVSGKGIATFDDRRAAQTTATFSEPDTYVLRLTADDGAFSANDEVTITVVAQLPDWTAYNDVSHGRNQLNHNITTFGLNQTGGLIDYATGVPIGVTLEIINNPSAPAVAGGTGGPMPNEGTDAYETFHGIVSFANVIYYGRHGWWVDAVFTGLNPDHRYEFATSANRGNTRYNDRWSKVTISDVESATEASTEGVTVLSNVSVAFCSGNNTANGYVARWTGIDPGDNGSFKVRVEAGGGDGMHRRNGYAFDGIMLRDLGSTR